ncbi:TPA: tetratricopeptide repeat protein [Candidatus Gracilibacteria bacterium]|nr:tetratricopeptide repeat protein [Candidatus Gracilibacteria bacterium]
MKKDLLLGIIMLAVGSGVFYFAMTSKNIDFFTVNSLDQQTQTPAPQATDKAKISLSPTPTAKPEISLIEKLKKANNAIKNGELEYASTLLENEEHTEHVLEILIKATLGQGMYFDAEQYTKELVSLNNSKKNIKQYAEILLLSGKVADAKTLLPLLNDTDHKLFYEMIIAVTENNHEVVQLSAENILNSKSSEKYKKSAQIFIDIYKTYESFRDGSPDYLTLMLGNALKTLKFHELTIIYIKPILEKNPNYRDAWIVIGNSYLELRKYEIAEKMLEKAVSLDPSHPISPYLLGITLYEEGQTEDAISQLKTAVKNGYTPRYKAEKQIGDMYFGIEKFKDALEHYQYVLEQGEPTLGDYSKATFIALQKLKVPSLGRSFAENAIVDFSNNPTALALKGWALLDSGNLITAKQYIENLAVKYPASLDVILLVGKLREAEKNYQSAFDLYKKCYDSGTTSGNIIYIECAQEYERLRKELQK